MFSILKTWLSEVWSDNHDMFTWDNLYKFLKVICKKSYQFASRFGIWRCRDFGFVLDNLNIRSSRWRYDLEQRWTKYLWFSDSEMLKEREKYVLSILRLISMIVLFVFMIRIYPRRISNIRNHDTLNMKCKIEVILQSFHSIFQSISRSTSDVLFFCSRYAHINFNKIVLHSMNND